MPLGGMISHVRYSSGSVSAVMKLRTRPLASASPPMSSNDVSGLTCTSTRPVSSASFSPSLLKISPWRRWMAPCGPSASTDAGTGTPWRGESGATRLDPLARAGARHAIGLLEHALLREDGRLGPDGEGDRVGRPRVQLHRTAPHRQVQGGVVGVVAQVGDPHLS